MVRSRAPLVAAGAAIAPAAVVVLVGSSSRVEDVLLGMVLFAGSWVAASLFLAMSSSPARSGLLAGAYVAAVVLWMVTRIGDEPDFVFFVWAPFGGMAMAFGAVSGAVTARLVRSEERAIANAAALALAAVLAGVYLLILQPPGVLLLLWLVPIAYGASAWWLVASPRRAD